MSKIRTTEDPSVRWAKLFGKMYYYMAKQMIESLGEVEGKKAITAAINEFGRARVAQMKEEAAERNLPANGLDTYSAVREMPGIGWEWGKCGVEHCPLHEIWSDFGDDGLELGKLYCEIDYVLLNGFGVKLDRNYCLTSGDKYCDFIYSDLKEK